MKMKSIQLTRDAKYEGHHDERKKNEAQQVKCNINTDKLCEINDCEKAVGFLFRSAPVRLDSSLN